ncbi:TBC1 domain family member 13-like [Oopsacas minuta]|uniref:TBC1 domain family member 13 n=1 Tax=Oopsacas minuta TaxID=111878 RepID=A0AAV7JWZ6_9METZ|nr:TBC1 domain family member 13-like [Oopsacas minuta]
MDFKSLFNKSRSMDAKHPPTPKRKLQRSHTFSSGDELCRKDVSQSPKEMSHKKRLSFNKHIKSPVETVISDEEIDLSLLNKICFTSGVEGHATRSVAWKLMLGYLPLKKDTWDTKLKTVRQTYWSFVQDLVINPGAIQAPGDHPLSQDTASNWKSFFEENKVLQQINYDSRRLYPDISFFQLRTEYPCAVEGIGKLRERVENDNLETLEVKESRKGIQNLLKQKQGELFKSISVNEKANEAHWEVVERILFIYAKINKGLGYVQGMNEIIGPIYYVFGNDPNLEWRQHAEPDTFYCFTNLMSEIGDNFCKSMDHTQYGIQAMMTKLMTKLNRGDPELHANLIEKNIDPHYFSFRWITLLLSQEFFLPDLIELWDVLFSDEIRFEFLYDICCAMLIIQRKAIIEADFGNTIKLLQHYPETPVTKIAHLAVEFRDCLMSKRKKSSRST